MRSLRKLTKRAYIWLLLPLICAFSLWPSLPLGKDKYFEMIKSIDIFVTLFKSLNHHYVGEIEPLALIEESLTHMLSQLDPYTVYISEEKISSHQLNQSKATASSGLVIDQRKEGYFVRSIHPSSAASPHKELHIGDLLESINQLPLDERSLLDVQQLLTGQAGQVLSLKFTRPLSPENYTIDLRLSQMKSNSVPQYEILSGTQIGYLRLSQFTRTASADLRSAFLSLKSAGAQSLIIDLRDNGGGLLREAIRISNFFVPKGSEIVRSKGKTETWNKVYLAEQEPIDTEIPIIALVNKHSASASEILCGVLQDYDRGLIIGTKTYGKGLIQTTLPLSYQAQLRVTTAYYYTPSGRCIQAIDYTSRSSSSTTAYDSASQRTFYTQNRRPVYDRGGISPDIWLAPPTSAPLLRLLQDSLLLFDYATRYKSQHPQLSDTLSFSLSDEEYPDFQQWLLAQQRAYQTPALQALQSLKASLRQQKPSSPRIQRQIQDLETALRDQLKDHLSRYQSDIRGLLSRSIALRYQSAGQPSPQLLSQDPYVVRAQQLLSDTAQYTQLLGTK